LQFYPLVNRNEGPAQWVNGLVGQFLEKSPNFSLFQKATNLLWGKQGGVEVRFLRPKLYQTLFLNQETRDWYIDRATPMRKHLDCANVCIVVVVEDEIQGSIMVELEKGVLIEVIWLPPKSTFRGGVLRDHDGNWILRFNRRLGKCSVYEAKLWDILDGVSLVQGRQHDRILLLQNVENWSIEHIPREENVEANHIAKLAFDREEGLQLYVASPFDSF
ncbi:hypothetical protein Godav_019071, partial [Gossypium davidsonii]|nr:hypothetical protein [Gossypium davidsonii]